MKAVQAPNAEIRAFVKALQQRGHKTEFTGSGHVRVTHRDDPSNIYILPSTPSGKRWRQNTLADLRRAGFIHGRQLRVRKTNATQVAPSIVERQRASDLRAVMRMGEVRTQKDLAALLIGYGQERGLPLYHSKPPKDLLYAWQSHVTSVFNEHRLSAFVATVVDGFIEEFYVRTDPIVKDGFSARTEPIPLAPTQEDMDGDGQDASVSAQNGSGGDETPEEDLGIPLVLRNAREAVKDLLRFHGMDERQYVVVPAEEWSKALDHEFNLTPSSDVERYQQRLSDFLVLAGKGEQEIEAAKRLIFDN